MKIKLAEALLRRKELNEKVERLRAIDKRELFETRTGRKAASEGIDDIIAEVAKISFQQFTHCFDWHSKQLRKVDALIQQANWNTELEAEQDVMGDYVDPYVKVK